jgi:heme A synthase
VTPAVFQHGRGNLALFLHVLGATTLFGAVVVLVTLAIAARRSADPQPTARVLFRVWLFAVLPAFILLRVAAEWILSLEKKDIPDLGNKGWVGVGFLVTDAGFIVLLALGVSAFFASRRDGHGRATTVTAVLGSIYLAALVAAWFAMSAKPGM